MGQFNAVQFAFLSAGVSATAVETHSDNTVMFATIIAILVGIIVYMQITRNKAVDVEQLTMGDVVSLGSKPEETLDGHDRLIQELDKAEKTFEKELTGNLTKNGFVQLRNLCSTMV